MPATPTTSHGARPTGVLREPRRIDPRVAWSPRSTGSSRALVAADEAEGDGVIGATGYRSRGRREGRFLRGLGVFLLEKGGGGALVHGNFGGGRQLGSGHRGARRARGKEEPVGVMHRRERERTEAREGSGWSFMAGRWCTMDECAGEVVAIARGHGGSCVRVLGICRYGLRPGEGREGAGEG